MKEEKQTQVPCSMDFEKDILGCILVKGLDWLAMTKTLLGKIGVNAFYSLEAQAIYNACLELENHGKPIGIVTVGDFLKKKGKDKIDLPFLESLTSYSVDNEALFIQELKDIRDYAYHRKILGISAMVDGKGLVEIEKDLKAFLEERQEAVGIGKDEEPQSVAKSLKEGVPEIRYLIGEGLLPSEGYSMVAGKAKQRKTTLCLYWALCLATKTPVFIRKDGGKQYAFPIVKQAKTLYLYGEGQIGFVLGIIKHQIEGLERRLNRKITEKEKGLIELKRNKDVYLDTKEGISALRKILKTPSGRVVSKGSEQYDLVIIDPVSLFTTGDIDKSQCVLAIVNSLQRLSREFDCVFLLVHHGRKDRRDAQVGSDKMDNILGSSAWRNSYESCVFIERWSETKGALIKELTFEFRNAQSPDPMITELDPETLIPEPKSKEEALEASTIDVFRLRDLISREFDGKGFPTEIIDAVFQRYEVKQGRVRNLFAEGMMRGLFGREKGKGGRWFVIEEKG